MTAFPFTPVESANLFAALMDDETQSAYGVVELVADDDITVECGDWVRYSVNDSAFTFVGEALTYDTATDRFEVEWEDFLGIRKDWLGRERLTVVLKAAAVERKAG